MPRDRPTKGIVSGQWSQYYPGPSDLRAYRQLNPVTSTPGAVHEYKVATTRTARMSSGCAAACNGTITNDVQSKSGHR